MDTGEPLSLSIRDMLTGVNDVGEKPYFDADGNSTPPSEWQMKRFENWQRHEQSIGESGARRMDAGAG